MTAAASILKNSSLRAASISASSVCANAFNAWADASKSAASAAKAPKFRSIFHYRPLDSEGIGSECPSPSGRLLLHLEHRPPDGGPFAILIAKHPQIPAACAISFARTLVDHFIGKGNDGCVAEYISFVVVILKFMNPGV